MEIKDIEIMLKDHENRIKQLEGKPHSKTTNSGKKVGKKSITDVLLEIKEEGFFDKPKSQKEIESRFEELGHIYESNSLNSPIARALRSRKIGRKKIDGIWHYVKR